MTEYDYSPEAFERHMEKQHSIAKWVDQTHLHEPANPFTPLPGEHGTATGTHVTPQHAFYADPSGVISPTYAHHPPKKHRHPPRKSHTTHPSPVSVPTMLPLPFGGYATRSYSSPPSIAGQSFVTPPHSAPVMYSGGFTGYPPPAPYVAVSPYASPPVSSYPTYSHPSYSRPSSAHASAGYVMQPQAQTFGGVTYIQPQPHQPIVYPVNGGNGGYMVIPAGGQPVQMVAPQYAQPKMQESQSFFGSLNLKGTSLLKSKKKRNRRDSY